QAPQPLALHDPVIVEVERGQDLGRVSALGEAALKKCGRGCHGCTLQEAADTKATRRIVRRASPGDVAVADQLRQQEEDVRRKVRERVQAHGLPMKVSDAEWQWDRHKLTIYFTAEQRVDFRALGVEKVLAVDIFRERVTLRNEEGATRVVPLAGLTDETEPRV